jgi:hypothetical protein
MREIILVASVVLNICRPLWWSSFPLISFSDERVALRTLFWRFVRSFPPHKRDNKLRRSLFCTLLHITFFSSSQREEREKGPKAIDQSTRYIFGEYQRASSQAPKGPLRNKSLSLFFRWWESKRSQHLFFVFCLGNHRRTHSSSVRTYSSACVCVDTWPCLYYTRPTDDYLKS